jgi:hypothetical protein
MTSHAVPFGEEPANEGPMPRERLCGRIKWERREAGRPRRTVRSGADRQPSVG